MRGEGAVPGADEGVEAGDRVALGDGQVPGAGHLPLDVNAVEGGAQDFHDVLRLVGEEVARVLVPFLPARDRAPDPVGDAAAVGVEQAADQFLGVAVDNVALPGSQFDPALVLPAGAVLREKAGPVLPPGDHLGAPRPGNGADPVVRQEGLESADALVGETGPGVGAEDAQTPHLLLAVAGVTDAAVAEVEAEQVAVGGLRLRQRREWSAADAHLFRAFGQFLGVDDPVADSRAGDAGLAADLTDGQPGTVHGDRLAADVERVHVSTIGQPSNFCSMNSEIGEMLWKGGFK